MSIPAIFTAVKAAGTATGASTWIADADTIQIGNIVYRFKNTPAQVNDIYVQATPSSAKTIVALANLVAAINGTGAASSTTYYTGTVKHKYVKASVDGTGLIVTITALLPGTQGNLITFVATSSGLGVDAATLGTTTAGTGSTHADLNTWIAAVRARNQFNAQIESEFEALSAELT